MRWVTIPYSEWYFVLVIIFRCSVYEGKIGMLKEYIDIGYTPDETDFVCEYHLEPASGISFEEACNHMAGECSIGGWSDISHLSPKLAEKLKPHVFYINKKKHIVRVSYPQDLFEFCSVSQIISTVAGNIFNSKMMTRLKLHDMTFPADPVSELWGPKYGIGGIRELAGVYDRPLVISTVKPKIGLDPATHANVAYQSFVGGCDLVKDDENLTDQKFNRFEKRVELTFKARDDAEEKTGERKMYMCNITAPTCEEMIRRANFISNIGGHYVMIDTISTGWSSLQTLRDVTEELGLAIHAHSMSHAAFTRVGEHGISLYLITKLARLVGLDQLYIGNIADKVHENKKELMALHDCCVMDKVKSNEKMHILSQNWDGIRPTFPVVSSGSEPALIPELMKIFGKDVIIEFGSAIHTHPIGTVSDARACRQAIDAVLAGTSLEEYGKSHAELQAALNNGM